MAKHQYPSEKQDQYMLRFPDGMRDTLKHFAAENKRSLNAEIIARLQLTLRQETLDHLALPEGKWQDIIERAVRTVLAERDDKAEAGNERANGETTKIK